MADPGKALERLGANMLACEECGDHCPTRSCYWLFMWSEMGEPVNGEPLCSIECGRQRRARHKELSPNDRWTLFDAEQQVVE